MLIFVQTRGEARRDDYGFLGAGPEEQWWRRYREHTSFELPTLLLHSSGEAWRAWLSGIPSARRDAVGTTIRFTVVLAGDCADTEDRADALALLGWWLTDVTTGTRCVGTALDEAFPGPDVERLLTCRTEEGGQEARWRALDLLRALPAPNEGEEPEDVPERWVGRLDAPRLPAALLRQSAELLSGVPGRALVLNLIGSRSDADALVEDDTPLAILVDDDGGGGLGEAAEELHPKKAPAPSGPTSREAALPGSRWSAPMRWLAKGWRRMRRWLG